MKNGSKKLEKNFLEYKNQFIILKNKNMKTLKELKEYFWDSNNPEIQWYCEWYKDAIELIFNHIIDSEKMSVEIIEKYLHDLINNK